MSDLDKAREWAKRWEDGSEENDPFIDSEELALIGLIKSLPDQWVDVKEVQEIIEEMESLPATTGATSEIAIATEAWKRRLEALVPSKLPTLADMTPEERAASQFMQARLEGGMLGIIVHPGDPRSSVISEGGGFSTLYNNLVTPLPGEPKLKWPGSGDAQEPAKASLDPQENIDASLEYRRKIISDQRSSPSEAPKSSIKPEDVPANEPWLIEAEGKEAVGTRCEGYLHVPWSAAALDGSFAGDYGDSDVTLIHKLVPEPPALPEGMRLADHKSYGRVVVAPHANAHGEESFYRTNDDISWGASHGYRPTGEFNFLDDNNLEGEE